MDKLQRPSIYRLVRISALNFINIWKCSTWQHHPLVDFQRRVSPVTSRAFTRPILSRGRVWAYGSDCFGFQPTVGMAHPKL